VKIAVDLNLFVHVERAVEPFAGFEKVIVATKTVFNIFTDNPGQPVRRQKDG